MLSGRVWEVKNNLFQEPVHRGFSLGYLAVPHTALAPLLATRVAFASGIVLCLRSRCRSRGRSC